MTGIPLRYIMLVVGIGATTVIFTILPIWQSEIAHKTIPAISILTDRKLSLLVIAAALFVTLLCAVGLAVFTASLMKGRGRSEGSRWAKQANR